MALKAQLRRDVWYILIQWQGMTREEATVKAHKAHILLPAYIYMLQYPRGLSSRLIKVSNMVTEQVRVRVFV
jgi:hypothetical protein